MRNAVLIIALLSAILGLSPKAAAQEAVPRTIIALYEGGDVQNANIHMVVEQPLNYLGLSVEYHDIHDPLPDLTKRKDVRGVVTWFYGDAYENPEAFLRWALETIDSGKKFVVIGSFGIPDAARRYALSVLTNRFLEKLGLKTEGHWVGKPLDVSYEYKTPSMFLTPAPYDWLRPAYDSMQVISDDVKVHLIAHKPGTTPDSDSALMVTGPNGGYVDVDYAVRANKRADYEVSQWLINPYEFFRLAFATDDLPKPDTTTIAGRRIYYSNIDGDGWNNLTRLEEYRGKNILSAQVIMDKAIKPYPDLPVMVAPIAADVDLDWSGSEESRRVAREIWALPQVEAGSHTFSHPFSWEFFEDGNWQNEVPYLHLYHSKTWQPDNKTPAMAGRKVELPSDINVPRAFAAKPFDINLEIEGALKSMASLLPKGKKIDILAWPGDCSPWEDVIRMTRDLHIENINGGDSRLDPEYPSYASLAPLSRQVGKQRQIYNSTSNENTYTDLWEDNFHAFLYLKTMLENSETPVRLSAMSVYYHIFTGEREASLNALLSNLNYARTQDIAPVTSAHFARIVDGFFDAQMIPLGNDSWRIDNRGALQTIRFDRSTLKSVDFGRSHGIIGERHFQGSLYVYLDTSVTQPVIALKSDDHYYAPPDEQVSYLVESRWVISDLERAGNRFEFNGEGFGNGDMTWHVRAPGPYRVTVNGKTEKIDVSDDKLLKLHIEQNAIQPLHITITEASNA